MSGACESLIDFEVLDSFTWQRSNTTPDSSSINEKLEFISEVSGHWERFGKPENPSVQESVKDSVVKSIYYICQSEGIGVNYSNTQHIFSKIQNRKRRTIKRSKRRNKHNSRRRNMQNSKYKDDKNKQSNTRFQETVNLFKAFQMLQKLGKVEAEDDQEVKGLLELESYVINIHKCLLSTLFQNMAGGVFSTEVRQTIFDGQLHQYPKFETEYEAADAAWRILDRYNTLYYYSVRPLKNENRTLYLTNFIKCAAYLFYELLSLHPFGDGNGRLCQLILNYLIQTVTPFPVPLFKDRQSYLNAVVAPRRTDGKPRDLTNMIIDSIFSCWKKFYCDLVNVNNLNLPVVLEESRPRHRTKSNLKIIPKRNISKHCRTEDRSCLRVQVKNLAIMV